MNRIRYLSLSGLLVLTGCALTTIGPSGLDGSATLAIRPAVRDGAYRTQHTTSEIRHLIVKLFKLASDGSESEVLDSGGLPLTLDVPGTRLDGPVTFSNLAFDNAYRVRAYAYADAATASLISSDAGSYVDVVVERDDRPGLATLPVRLIDQVFNGMATASTIAVTPGGFAYPENERVGLSPMLMAVVSTLAGQVKASGNVDGTGAAAKFYVPMGMAMDGAGTLYVADYINKAIRRIVPSTGEVSTLVGAGLSSPIGIVADGSGHLYVADCSSNVIRQVDSSTGAVSLLAGAEGASGFADGIGTAARFAEPAGLALDGLGNLYVSDSYYQNIRKIVLATGEVTTLAGPTTDDNWGSADGTGTAARFNRPRHMAADGAGHLYVADLDNCAIRQIVLATGEVTTFAGSMGSGGDADGTGTDARFYNPSGLALDQSGHLYVSDIAGQTIRKINLSTRAVTTWAGTSRSAGSADGTGPDARFDAPDGLAVDGTGTLYVADAGNHTIRKIAPVFE